MASTSETGHAKNVANLQDLIALVTGFGPTYNPSKAALKLPALNTLFTGSTSALSDLITKNTAFNNATNDRAISYANIQSLSTRCVHALQATDASTEKIKDAKGFNRKIQGKRAAGSNQQVTAPDAPR